MRHFNQIARIQWGGVRAILLSLAVCGCGYPAFASSGTEGAAFLNIPIGAGPAALGSAYSALANDAYAPVWNPSGLGDLNGTEIAGQHLSYLESVNYEYASFVHPFKNSHQGFGFSAQYLNTGKIAGTDNSGTSTGDYDSHFAAYTLGYGRQFLDRLSLGVSGKLIDEKISDVSAHAYAADLGALYKLSERFRVAGVLANIGNRLTFLNDGDPLPLALRVGAAYQPESHWLASAEAVYRKSGLASAHLGLAWQPIEMIVLRAGYKTDTLKGLSALAGITGGIGLNLYGHEFSYAFVPYGDLGTTQYFSLILRFGEKKDQKRNLIQYQTIHQHYVSRHDMPATVSESQRGASADVEYDQLMQLLSDTDKELFTRREPSQPTEQGADQ